MKKNIVAFFCYAVCLPCMAQEKYTVQANIRGLGNDTVYCMMIPLTVPGKGSDADQRMDTLFAREGVFTYTLPVQEPAIVAIIPRTAFYKKPHGGLYLPKAKTMEFILEPTDHITVQGTLDSNYFAYAVSGSTINETLAAFRAGYKDLDRKVEILDERVFQTVDTAENRRLWTESLAAKGVITQQKLNFVAQNPDNPVSAYYLLNVPIPSFGVYYPKLGPKAREGIFRTSLEAKYKVYGNYIASSEAKERLQTGVLAPAFSLKTINGALFTLADRPRSTYVVLDFWGSWCMPCMEEMPKLKEYQAKYKDSITFIGIACNDDKARWRQTVDRGKLDWLQLIDDKEKSVSVLYGVQAYPTKVILDKDLRIVRKFVGEDKEFYKMLDEMGGK